jgi:hypothetical protein
VLGILACGVSYVVLRMVEKHSHDKNRFKPRIEAVIGGSESAED